MKTVINICMVVLAITLLLPVAASSEDLSASKLIMWVDPVRMNADDPCPATKDATLYFRNNDSENPITVVWSSTWVDPTEGCVSGYAPASGVVELGPGAVAFRTITVSFAGTCSGFRTINFTGTVQGFPDIGSATLNVVCGRRAPSLTTWGLIVLTVLLLGSGLYIAYRRRPRVIQ